MQAVGTNRRFAAYLVAAALTDSGYWITLIAQGWLVVKLTNSPLWLGVISAVSQLPFLLFSLLGGQAADRFNRRYVIIICGALSVAVAATTALLVATNAIELWSLGLLGFIAGTLTAIEHPVDRAWIYDLIGGKGVGRAIGLSSLEWAMARTFGPAVGGVAIAAIGIAAGFGAYAVLVLPMIALAAIVRTHNSKAGEDEPAAQNADVPRHAIVAFSIFTGLFTVGITPYTALLPEIAKNTFGQGASGYGLMSAAGGVGAMIGAIALSVRGDFRFRGRATVVSAIAGALLLFTFSLQHALIPAVIALVAMGAVDTLMYALGNTYVQRIAGNDERGHANAVFAVAFLGAIPIGNALLGVLAGRFGSQPVLGASAIVVGVASAAFWFLFPRTRDAA